MRNGRPPPFWTLGSWMYFIFLCLERERIHHLRRVMSVVAPRTFPHDPCESRPSCWLTCPVPSKSRALNSSPVTSPTGQFFCKFASKFAVQTTASITGSIADMSPKLGGLPLTSRSTMMSTNFRSIRLQMCHLSLRTSRTRCFRQSRSCCLRQARIPRGTAGIVSATRTPGSGGLLLPWPCSEWLLGRCPQLHVELRSIVRRLWYWVRSCCRAGREVHSTAGSSSSPWAWSCPPRLSRSVGRPVVQCRMPCALGGVGLLLVVLGVLLFRIGLGLHRLLLLPLRLGQCCTETVGHMCAHCQCSQEGECHRAWERGSAPAVSQITKQDGAPSAAPEGPASVQSDSASGPSRPAPKLENEVSAFGGRRKSLGNLGQTAGEH
jgi:hypothetical protein